MQSILTVEDEFSKNTQVDRRKKSFSQPDISNQKIFKKNIDFMNSSL